MCVCMSHYLPSCLKSVWKAGSIIRTVLAWASYVPKFTTLSRNFGYFSCFWTNFNMLGIQMHIIQAKKLIGDIEKGHWPQKGAESPHE